MRRLVGAELPVAVVGRVGRATTHRARGGTHAAKDGELHGVLLVVTWGPVGMAAPIVVSEAPDAGVPDGRQPTPS
ncbi:hypothetical protein GCM10009826_03430 [Humibacillus xanthopallidus]